MNKNYIENYNSDGYVIEKDIISMDKIIEFENTLKRLININENTSLPEALKNLEKNDKTKFYNLCTKEIWFTTSGLSLICDSKLLETVSKIFGSKPGNLSPVGHAIFWNDPSCERLQYKWHQEASYYPNHKNIISIWFPIINDILLESGPMIIAKGSHKKHLDYTKIGKDNHVTQLEVDEKMINNFQHTPCVTKRGDAVIFHQNAIHKTGINTSNTPRTSGIIRFADLTNEKNKQSYWAINKEF